MRAVLVGKETAEDLKEFFELNDIKFEEVQECDIPDAVWRSVITGQLYMSGVAYMCVDLTRDELIDIVQWIYAIDKNAQIVDIAKGEGENEEDNEEEDDDDKDDDEDEYFDILEDVLDEPGKSKEIEDQEREASYRRGYESAVLQMAADGKVSEDDAAGVLGIHIEELPDYALSYGIPRGDMTAPTCKAALIVFENLTGSRHACVSRESENEFCMTQNEGGEWEVYYCMDGRHMNETTHQTIYDAVINMARRVTRTETERADVLDRIFGTAADIYLAEHETDKVNEESGD